MGLLIDFFKDMDYSIFSIATLFIAAAYFFAGIIDSICGGGGLLTVPALMAVGIPTENVIGTNQCAALPGAYAAVYKFIRSQKIHYKSALCAIPFSAMGAFLGAKLNLLIPVSYLQNMMIVLVPVLAIITIFNKTVDGVSLIDEMPMPQMFVRAMFIGFFVGGYQGFYGPGAGMFFIMGFSLLLKLDLVRSAGNARLVLAISTLSAVTAYVASGTVLWKISAVGAVFYIAGSYLGACLAIENGQKIIRPITVVVSILLVVKVAFFR